MMFFFKRKQIYLDCFTQYSIVATDNPIQKSSNFVPNWWKSIPKTVKISNDFGVVTDNPTMKRCAGFKDLYSSGLIIPLWCDLNIRIDNDKYAYQFRFPDSSISSHATEQYNNAYHEYVHMKIINVWRFREKTGVKFICAENPWEKLLKYPKMNILNGILDFKYQVSCNINVFCPKESKPYQIDLLAGTPLVQLIPISNKKVKPVIHVVDEKEFARISRYHTPYKFTNWYYEHKKTLQKNKIK